MRDIKNKNSIHDIGEKRLKNIRRYIRKQRYKSILRLSSFTDRDIDFIFFTLTSFFKIYKKYLKLTTSSIKIRIFNFQIRKRT